MFVAVAELKTDVAVGESGIVNYVNRLHTVQPGLNVVAFGDHVIMVPASVDDQLVGKIDGILLHHAGAPLLPQAAPIAFAHVDLVSGNVVGVGGMDANAYAGICISAAHADHYVEFIIGVILFCVAEVVIFSAVVVPVQHAVIQAPVAGIGIPGVEGLQHVLPMLADWLIIDESSFGGESYDQTAVGPVARRRELRQFLTADSVERQKREQAG